MFEATVVMDDAKTVESVPNARPCMFVALSDAQATACSKALGGAVGMRVANEEDACALMPKVLPFVVVVKEDVSIGEARSMLCEVAAACGAEVVTIAEQPDAEELGARLLEALCVAELRRMDSEAAKPSE